ncbi:MAG: hypothetical protein HUK15_01690, partial [Bacteroidales bacterium]|nr:hypothetical protein [Bacteroidales bacterium]
FSDNITYKKHNSVSGDGSINLRYKTFCDSILAKEIALMRYNVISWSQRYGMDNDEIQQTFSTKYRTPFLDMLNVKYLVLSGKVMPLVNDHASGNAWFADSLRWAATENDELLLLKQVNPRYTAVINEKFKADFANIEFGIDSTDFIMLESFGCDTLVYKSCCSSPRMAVFSEIFCPKGWKSYIDGEKSSHLRANYTLRALLVPAGEHEIMFCYSPSSAKWGRLVALASNILFVVAVFILAVVFVIKSIRKK